MWGDTLKRCEALDAFSGKDRHSIQQRKYSFEPPRHVSFSLLPRIKKDFKKKVTFSNQRLFHPQGLSQSLLFALHDSRLVLCRAAAYSVDVLLGVCTQQMKRESETNSKKRRNIQIACSPKDDAAAVRI